ncbi:MAG: hypothetical protein OXP75_19615 [Rhodospirillales bacterium]|nr:hypothetical protein [Rhodospirillales bacterium]
MSIGKEVNARLRSQVIDVFHRGHQIASHLRNDAEGRATTVEEHRPVAHQRAGVEETRARLEQRARDLGSNSTSAPRLSPITWPKRQPLARSNTSFSTVLGHDSLTISREGSSRGAGGHGRAARARGRRRWPMKVACGTGSGLVSHSRAPRETLPSVDDFAHDIRWLPAVFSASRFNAKDC